MKTLGVLCLGLVMTISAAAQDSTKSKGSVEKKQASQTGVVHRDLAAREASTGKATGVTSPRDIASGQASGKRVAVGDVDADGAADVKAPRDAASGQASGKRSTTAAGQKGVKPRDVATGQASGKRQH